MRIIVYPWDVTTGGAGLQGADLSDASQPQQPTTNGPLPSKPDAYTDKIVKYVPGEAIAFFLPAYTLAASSGALGLWAVLIVTPIGSLLWLAYRAKKEARRRPPLYFYILSFLAVLAWMLGTSTIGLDLLGLSQGVGRLVLTVAVFLIPVIDGLLTNEELTQ